MNRLWLAAALAGFATAQPALPQTQPAAYPAEAGRSCVPVSPGEAKGAYESRARAYCEARWSDLVSHRATGFWKHPEWIQTCLRRCEVGELQARQVPGLDPAAASAIASAAAGVALATAAATSNPNPAADLPASP
jgi:hypothetical protein